MKAFALFTVFFTGMFSVSADYTIEDISPHLGTNVPILWEAPTRHLTNSFWTYEKMPRIFSAATLSNAVILASLQSQGFPKPSTNQVTIWTSDRSPYEMQPPYLSIWPADGTISYRLGGRAPDTTEKVANDAAAVQRAWDCLAQLDMDRTQFVKTNDPTAGGWGVFLPRLIDGIPAFQGAEGFAFQQFIESGKIRHFYLNFPNLKPIQKEQTATPQQIIACIRASKTPVKPSNSLDYFERIKSLSQAKALHIMKITPYYSEDFYGDKTATNNEPSKIVAPLAMLDTVADFGNSNLPVQLFSPIVAPHVKLLLETK